MQRVVVTVKRKDEARVRDLEVPADIDAVRLAKLIAGALGWGSDRAGQPLTYQIEAHPLGRILQAGESLASAGVWDGSWLILHADIVEAPAVNVKPTPAETPPTSEPEPVAPKPPVLEAIPAQQVAKTMPSVEASTAMPAEVSPKEEPAAIAGTPSTTRPPQESVHNEALSNAGDQTPHGKVAAYNASPTERPAIQEALPPVEAVETPSISTPRPLETAQGEVGEEAKPTGGMIPSVQIETTSSPEPYRVAWTAPISVPTQKGSESEETRTGISDQYDDKVIETQPDNKERLPAIEATQISPPSWVTEAQPVDEILGMERTEDISQASTTTGDVEDDDSWLKLFLETTSGTETSGESIQTQPAANASTPNWFVSDEQGDRDDLPVDEDIASTFEPLPEIGTSFAHEAAIISNAAPVGQSSLSPGQTPSTGATQPISQAEAVTQATPASGPTKPSELATPGAGPVAGWRKVVDLTPTSEPDQTQEKPQSRFVWKQLDEE